MATREQIINENRQYCFEHNLYNEKAAPKLSDADKAFLGISQEQFEKSYYHKLGEILEIILANPSVTEFPGIPSSVVQAGRAFSSRSGFGQARSRKAEEAAYKKKADDAAKDSARKAEEARSREEESARKRREKEQETGSGQSSGGGQYHYKWSSGGKSWEGTGFGEDFWKKFREGQRAWGNSWGSSGFGDDRFRNWFKDDFFKGSSFKSSSESKSNSDQQQRPKTNKSAQQIVAENFDPFFNKLDVIAEQFKVFKTICGFSNVNIAIGQFCAKQISTEKYTLCSDKKGKDRTSEEQTKFITAIRGFCTDKQPLKYLRYLVEGTAEKYKEDAIKVADKAGNLKQYDEVDTLDTQSLANLVVDQIQLCAYVVGSSAFHPDSYKKNTIDSILIRKGLIPALPGSLVPLAKNLRSASGLKSVNITETTKLKLAQVSQCLYKVDQFSLLTDLARKSGKNREDILKQIGTGENMCDSTKVPKLGTNHTLHKLVTNHPVLKDVYNQICVKTHPAYTENVNKYLMGEQLEGCDN